MSLSGFEGIGPYIVPASQQARVALLAAVSVGGSLIPGIHRAEPILYGDDNDRLRLERKSAMPRQWSCACGQPNVIVELPPIAVPLTAEGYGSLRPKGNTRICIRCDAGHLMPRLTAKEVN